VEIVVEFFAFCVMPLSAVRNTEEQYVIAEVSLPLSACICVYVCVYRICAFLVYDLSLPSSSLTSITALQ